MYPMPKAPPVTMATLPSRSWISFLGSNDWVKNGLHCFEAISIRDANQRIINEFESKIHKGDAVWLTIGIVLMS